MKFTRMTIPKKREISGTARPSQARLSIAAARWRVGGPCLVVPCHADMDEGGGEAKRVAPGGC